MEVWSKRRLWWFPAEQQRYTQWFMRCSKVVKLAITTATAVCSLGTLTAAASPKYSGDPATIAFYRTVAAKTAQKAGVRVVVKGFDYLNHSSTGWYGGPGIVPAGDSAVTDHILIAASHGHVVWLSDQLERPTKCRPSRLGNCAALLVVLDSAGLFTRSLAPGSPTCWYRGRGVIGGYSKVGPGVASGFTLYGHFDPMRNVNGTTYVTSTYPYGKQQATEIDTISYATRLPSASITRLAALPGYPARTFTYSYHWLAATPAKPRFTVCT